MSRDNRETAKIPAGKTRLIASLLKIPLSKVRSHRRADFGASVKFRGYQTQLYRRAPLRSGPSSLEQPAEFPLQHHDEWFTPPGPPAPLPSYRGGRPSRRAGRRMVVKQGKVAKGIHQEPRERRGEIHGLWRAWATGLRQTLRVPKRDGRFGTYGPSLPFT